VEIRAIRVYVSPLWPFNPLTLQPAAGPAAAGPKAKKVKNNCWHYSRTLR